MLCEYCNNTHDGTYASGRFCGTSCSHAFAVSTDNIRETKSVLCSGCQKPIVVNKRVNPNSILCEACRKIRQRDSLRRYRNILYLKNGDRLCKLCLEHPVFGKKQICDTCKIELYDKYRVECRFTFDVYTYPEYFDLALVSKYGWYSPSNKNDNPYGVSKDHLLSVTEGFKYRIVPSIMCHPANCKLILQIDNQRKRHHSAITLLELKERILQFDAKYAVLVKEE